MSRPFTLALAALGALALAPGCSDGEVHPVPVGGSPQYGPSDAWVTVVEFADFQCPYCAKAAATVHQIELAFPAADVRVVFKHLPLDFHEHAMPAALAAQCAFEQGAFWEIYNALYNDVSLLSDANLEAAAERLGLDLTAWKACLASEAAKQAVAGDVALADELGVSGTPTFFVNGYELVGAQPFSTFQELVARELTRAQDSGIDRASYYDQVVLGKK